MSEIDVRSFAFLRLKQKDMA